jgi:hypothetical protein
MGVTMDPNHPAVKALVTYIDSGDCTLLRATITSFLATEEEMTREIAGSNPVRALK